MASAGSIAVSRATSSSPRRAASAIVGRDGPEGLEPLFEQMVRALDPTRLYDVARRYHMSARLCLHRPEESGPAFYYAQTALDLVERSGYPIHDAAMLYTTFAYVCARRGDLPAGLAAVEKVAAESSGEQQRQQLSICLFLRAYAMLLSGFSSMAMSLVALRETGELKRRRGTPVPSWTFITAMIVRTAILIGSTAILMLAISHFAYDVAVPADSLLRIFLYVALGTTVFAGTSRPREEARPTEADAEWAPAGPVEDSADDRVDRPEPVATPF